MFSQNTEHTLFVEKYRPDNIDNYVGNPHIIDKVKIYLQSGDVPHLLLYGVAGTGKTTLAKIITNALDCDLLYINASDENSVDVIRDKVKGFASTIGFKKWKIVILDEADFITPNGQAALRNIMETFSKHTRFILTCNYVEKIIDPIQSRCQSFAVHPPSKGDVAKRLVEILNAEGVVFQNEDLVDIVNSGYPDIRRVINSAQSQIVDGKLVINKQSKIEAGYTKKVIEELKSSNSPKDKLRNIRQIIADSQVKTFEQLYSDLYDNIDDWGEGYIGPCITHIAEAQYRDALVVEKSINVAALMVNLISEVG